MSGNSFVWHPTNRGLVGPGSRDEPFGKRVLLVFRVCSRAACYTKLFELPEMLHKREGPIIVERLVLHALMDS
jgi:hypothetical protein